MQDQTTEPKFRVVMYPAVFGVPAEIVLYNGARVVAREMFSHGHVFTDNEDARLYGRGLASRLGAEFAVER